MTPKQLQEIISKMSQVGLPKGYTVDSGMYTTGDSEDTWPGQESWWTKWKAQQAEVEKMYEESRICSCGVSVTMGKDDHWEYHSDYCNIFINKIDVKK